VLRSFRDKDTKAVWERRRSRKLDAITQRAALRTPVRRRSRSSTTTRRKT
jgi:hypothetical protein